VTKPHDSDLMQHADGELDALDTSDPAARAKLDALGQGKELVRGHLELAADAVPDAKFAAMWQQIGKSLDHVHVDEVPQPARDGVAKRVRHWFERFRGHILTGVVSAGAVAALALVLRPGAHDDGITTSPIDVRPAAYRPTEIESIDTPAGNSSILSLQDEDGNTTVIWVTPEDTVQGI